jgi:methylenetetrahydrofolate dehydrogenase (NADP+)/methenyltetrahydrofolate cyclohydrolase
MHTKGANLTREQAYRFERTENSGWEEFYRYATPEAVQECGIEIEYLANATVTIVHTRTKDLASHTRRADILIVAAGVPEYIKGDQIKPGAVVIDVGVNRIDNPDPKAEKKTKLVGDVHFESAKEVASKITPVPGGVGPMTITMLMKNTIRAARLHHGIK